MVKDGVIEHSAAGTIGVNLESNPVATGPLFEYLTEDQNWPDFYNK